MLRSGIHSPGRHSSPMPSMTSFTTRYSAKLWTRIKLSTKSASKSERDRNKRLIKKLSRSIPQRRNMSSRRISRKQMGRHQLRKSSRRKPSRRKLARLRLRKKRIQRKRRRKRPKGHTVDRKQKERPSHKSQNCMQARILCNCRLKQR